jgi:hypothetical protein
MTRCRDIKLRYMEINKTILQLIEALSERPSMVLGKKPNYEMLKTFIDGYLMGLGNCFNVPLVLNITIWYKKKINININVFWSTYIPFQFKDKSDEEQKVILLNVLREYISENPQWMKEHE